MNHQASRRAFLALLLLASACSDNASLTGTVTHVRDGDTIVVDHTPIRLNGVAAPERGDLYGRESGEFMRQLVLGKPVTCELNGERSGDRLIGICYLDGDDIGATIIEAGLARDCPRFSGRRYADEELEAQAAGQDLSRSYSLPGYCL